MKTISFTTLALIALLLIFALWQILSGITLSNPLERISIDFNTITDYLSNFIPSGWWLVGLFAMVLTGALPFLLGLAMDHNGQSASGWLIVIGSMFSAIAIGCLLLAYLAGTALYLIYKLIFD